VTTPVAEANDSSNKDPLLRVTRIALVFNAVMASLATVGFIAGYAPYAAEHAILARRVAAGELAGVVIFILVAFRLHRDSFLIAFPLAFVFLQLTDSVYEFIVRRNPNDLPPMVIEGLFFSIYALYATSRLRARSATEQATRVAPKATT
jgi:hypothetical protein